MKDANDNKTKNEDDFDQADIAGTGGIQIMPNAPVSLTVRHMHGFKNLMNNNTAPATLMRYQRMLRMHTIAGFRQH